VGFKGKICEGKDWGEKGRVKLKPAADRFSLLTELPSHGIILCAGGYSATKRMLMLK